MKVLIGNFHNGSFGGGELYTCQVAKAIASFSEVLFLNEPNRELWNSNPQLKIKFRVWNGVERVDAYINLCHFQSLVCNTAEKNILGVMFPNSKHKVADFNEIVAICPYSAKYVAEFWNREALVCSPYSNPLTPGEKAKNTIVSVGNFFREADGHSKNQHLLIDAFKRLGKNWKLTLIGSVVHPEYLREVVKASQGLNVEVIPNCSEQQKNKILAESEFYWHANGYGRTDPYQTEHFGIAPEEALKAGCLVYVHNSGGAKDFCRSWSSIPELVRMTKDREPNKPDVVFQTPENMETFWRGLLCSAN